MPTKPTTHYITPAEAAATAGVGPAIGGLLPTLGGIALGIAVVVLLALSGVETATAIRAGLLCPLAGLVISALSYFGTFRAIVWLAEWWAGRPVVVDADVNGDGTTSQEEQDQATQLFTEDGLVAFVREYIYRRQGWKWETLVGGKVLTQDEYNLLINDILPTVGVLARTKGQTTTRALAAGAGGQPLGLAEAERRIAAYFTQPIRKVWEIKVDGQRVIL